MTETTTITYTDRYGHDHDIRYSAAAIEEADYLLPHGETAEDVLEWAARQVWKVSQDIGIILSPSETYGMTTEQELLHHSNSAAMGRALDGITGAVIGSGVAARIDSAAWIVGMSLMWSIEDDYPALDDSDYSDRLYAAREEAAVEELAQWDLLDTYPALAGKSYDEQLAVMIELQDYTGETGYFDNDLIGAM